MARLPAVADTALEEGGRHAHAQRLGRHAGAGALGVRGDHAERAEQKHEQVLRVDGQRGDESAMGRAGC